MIHGQGFPTSMGIPFLWKGTGTRSQHGHQPGWPRCCVGGCPPKLPVPIQGQVPTSCSTSVGGTFCHGGTCMEVVLHVAGDVIAKTEGLG